MHAHKPCQRVSRGYLFASPAKGTAHGWHAGGADLILLSDVNMRR